MVQAPIFIYALGIPSQQKTSINRTKRCKIHWKSSKHTPLGIKFPSLQDKKAGSWSPPEPEENPGELTNSSSAVADSRSILKWSTCVWFWLHNEFCFDVLKDWEEKELANQSIHISTMVQTPAAACDLQSRAAERAERCLLSSDRSHTRGISDLRAGFHACSCTYDGCMEMAELHHGTKHAVVTTCKEKVWFGTHHRSSISFENWYVPHGRARLMRWLFSKGHCRSWLSCSLWSH